MTTSVCTRRFTYLVIALIAATAAACGHDSGPGAGDDQPDAATGGVADAASPDGTVVAPGCGDGTCAVDEDCTTCAADCGFCDGCGDGSCDATEDCTSCASDCGLCASCPDTVCQASESCTSCPFDCGVCAATCGDGACDPTASETCATCPDDCGGPCTDTCTVDGQCKVEDGENCLNCADDCSACGTCGDGFCTGGETPDSCDVDCTT